MLPLSGERVNAKGIISEKLNSVDTIRGSSTLKRGFAHMQKNGVVMDVTNVEQALIAQEAGAVSVMVLDKLPSEVRKAGGVARTASIKIIEEIMDSVTIPVMAKCRIGHVSEALVLQETDVDMIDESEVLTPADELRHIWKWDLTTPVVNGARSLAEALRRIEEGASMIRTKGEPGTGNVAEAITHIKKVNDEIISQLKELPRAVIAKNSLLNNGILIHMPSDQKIIDTVNKIAPEHLELNTKNYKKVVGKIKNAGSICLGKYAVMAMTDYNVGSNHVLPTNSSARYSSGVSVNEFYKRISYINLSKKGIETLGPSVITLANYEGLAGHAKSVEKRIRRK